MRPGMLLALILTLFPAAATAQNAGTSRAERARRAEALIAAEPDAAQVRRRALRYFELNPDQLGRVRRTLRSKAGMPTLTVAGRYQQQRNDRELDIRASDGVDYHVMHDDFFTQGGRGAGAARWNLPGAAFTPAELQTYTLAMIQREIMATVNGWYYSRRQLQLIMLIDPPVDPRARTSLQLRIQGFNALLDTYTGGWYSRQLPQQASE